jgi:hypothetical protein
MAFGTEASAKRSATPWRLALEAIFVPISGQLYWLLVLCPWAQNSARLRLRWVRCLSRSRVARISAG